MESRTTKQIRRQALAHEQSKEAVALSHKIIAIHKRMLDAGYKPQRLDVKTLQLASKKALTGLYSQLLEQARGL